VPEESILLGELAEEFSARVRGGQLPSIEEYALAHPSLADRIRELFPTLMLLEGMAGAPEQSRPNPTDLTAGHTLGPYRIERELARGGMGVVYEARHLALQKRVALKVLPIQGPRQAGQLERFLREAKTAAGLHHTNIVPVFDVGQVAGIPYYAMQFIDGRSLDRILREEPHASSDPTGPYLPGGGGPVPSTVVQSHPFNRSDAASYRWIANIGIQAAEGLAYAHDRGVIHRDIKPSNLLLDEQGVAWITDFGLARRLDDPALTHSGVLLGTPRYMSPEQAAALKQPVDHRTDIYSLGATLYELLTHRPAFDGRTPQEVVEQIIHRDPPPPRRLNPSVPRDLETIVLKAMSKRPEDRYQGAMELAEDLRRWQRLEPIRARRIGPVGRFARWCQRNPALAAATGIAAAGLLAVTVISIVFALTQSRTNQSLADALTDLQEEQEQTQIEQRRTSAALTETRKVAAMQMAERAAALVEQHDTGTAILWLARALETAPEEDRELQYLLRISLGSLSAERPLPPAFFEHERFKDATVSRDGSILLREGPDGAFHLIESATGKELGSVPGPLYASMLSPDGKILLTLHSLVVDGQVRQGIRWWQVQGARPLGPIIEQPSSYSSMGFSPNGKSAMIHLLNGSTQLWETAPGRLIGTIPPGQGRNPWNRFSENGNELLTWNETEARVWDSLTARPVGQPLRLSNAILSADISSDGRTLLTGSSDKLVTVWDLASGKQIRTGVALSDFPYQVAFSPDGRTYATVSSSTWGAKDAEVRLWKMATNELIWKAPAGPTRPAFSPDGRKIMVGKFQSAEFWAADTGERISHPIQFGLSKSGSLDARFNLDSQLVVPGADWIGNVPASKVPPRVSLQTPSRAFVGPSQGAQTFHVIDSSRVPYVVSSYEALSGRPIASIQWMKDTHFLTAGTQGKAVGSIGGKQVHFIDLSTGKPIGPRLDCTGFGTVRQANFSSNGRFLAACGESLRPGTGIARVWEVDSGKSVGVISFPEGPVDAVNCSDDGLLLFTHAGAYRLHESTSGNLLGSPWTLPPQFFAVTVTPDCRTVVTGHLDGTVVRREASTGRELGLPGRHNGRIYFAQVSPDGASFLTAGADQTARLWDLATGRPVGLPFSHRAEVVTAAFSPDAKLVATVSGDRTARLWHRATGIPIGLPFEHAGNVGAVSFSSDGRTIWITGETLRSWDVPPALQGDPARITLWAQTFTGLELDAAGAVQTPRSAILTERRRQLDELGGPPVEIAKEEAQATDQHLRIAMDCLIKSQWYSAAWHFNAFLAARPDDWHALALRGLARLELGKLDDATRDYERAFQHGPAERVFALIDTHARRNEDSFGAMMTQAQREKSVWYLDRLIAARPRDWTLYHRRGRAYAALDKQDRAEVDYAAALPLKPDGEFFRGWGQFHADWGRWELAEADFTKQLEQEAENSVTWADALRNLAKVRFQLGNLLGYRESCAKLLQWRPDPASGGNADSVIEACTFSPDATEDNWRVAERSAARDHDSYDRWEYLSLLGETLYRAGRFEAAVHCLEQSLRITRKSDPMTEWLFLSLAHERLGHSAEAKKWRDKATERLDQAKGKSGPKKPVWPGTWDVKVKIEALRQEAEKLAAQDKQQLTDLAAVITQKPADPSVRLARGRFHANRAHWDMAEADFTKAIELVPDDPEPWFQRGRFHAQRGNPSKASDDFARAAEFRPNDPNWRTRCGREQAALWQWDRASADFARAIELRPDDVDVRIECGEAHAAGGEWKQALREFVRATEQNPDEPRVWYLLAVANLGEGNQAGYRETCEFLMKRFAGTAQGERGRMNPVNCACVLAPQAVAGAAVVTEFSKRLVGYSRPSPGALLYRAGRFREALSRLQIDVRSYGGSAPEWLFLAMSAQQLESTEDAKSWLAKAEQWMGAANRPESADLGNLGPRWQSWHQKFMAETLRREAGALIKPSKE
jgi:serine/threonine protein kinase/WD40 repeat protein/tetratricopeptide (TPR) repeat protein